MRALRRALRRLTSTWTRRADEERLRSEVDHHIALLTEENIRLGMSPVEARRQAILRFGPIEATKEIYRERRGLPWLDMLARDARLALRRLRAAPMFAAATITTLALGIGATTAIFTLVHAVVLKSLPVSRPEELYRLGKESRCCFFGGYSQEGGFSLVSYDLYRYLRDHTDTFTELAAFPAPGGVMGVRRVGSSEPARTHLSEFVSGNYFAMFGIRPYAGRLLHPADDELGASPAAVISHRLWHEVYGSDPTVVGGAFTLNGKPFTIVGVAPPGFFGGALRQSSPDIFLPLSLEPVVNADADTTKPDTHWLNVIGRLRAGVVPARAEGELRVALRQWLAAHRDQMTAADRSRIDDQTLFLSPGGAGITSLRDQYQHWLQILMLTSGFVLLIVCANVANLMLVRSMQRRQQTALSLALGARTWRVVVPPLVESIVLSLFGGALGLAIAYGGTRFILNTVFPPLLGSSVPIDATPSIPVLLFTLSISVATGVIFGVAPAWAARSVDPIDAIRGAARTATARSLPGRILVVGQAALALVLLSASALLILALQRLEHQRLGFDVEGQTIASIDPRLAGYGTIRLPLLYQRLHDSLASLPAVESVGLALYAPASTSWWGTGVVVDGGAAPPPSDNAFAVWNRVSVEFFDVVGTPIVRGRAFSDLDTATSPAVAIVNEAFARTYFGQANPLGKRFGRRDGPTRQFEIVGVVKDAWYVAQDAGKAVRPSFFLPLQQADYSLSHNGSLFLRDLVVRARPGARLSDADIRGAVAAADPNLPVLRVRSLEAQVASQFTQQRLMARLTSLFGILALVIASVGLYGVVAYNAGRRRNEIGVRMALGASRTDVIKLLLRGAFAPIVVGLAIGVPLTVAVGRFLGSQLYGVVPYDAVTTLAAILALGASALVASLIPAIRASRIAPLTALRTE